MNRRTFVAGSLLAAGATSYAATKNNKKLKVALIGCGRRGRGAVSNMLKADPNLEITVLADLFPDAIQNSLKILAKLKVKDTKNFVGFDAYKKAMAEDVDIVILTTPPCFRPAQIEEAVKQNKHIFAEKPLGVDPVGLRKVIAAVKKAKEKNLGFLTGFCYRFYDPMKEIVKRIHRGDIGDIINIQSTYLSHGIWPPVKGKSLLEEQIRSWVYYIWASGDQVVEQAVHSLDKVSWLLNDKPPIKVIAAHGGRQSRVDEKYGNVFDHSSATIVYANPKNTATSKYQDVYVNFACRQQLNTDPATDDVVLGSKGYSSLMRQTVNGKKIFKRSDRFGNMYNEEQKHFLNSIRNDDVLYNDGSRGVTSSMLAVMVREAVYTGKNITWDQISNSKLDMSQKLDFAVKPEIRDIPRQGITPFI